MSSQSSVRRFTRQALQSWTVVEVLEREIWFTLEAELSRSYDQMMMSGMFHKSTLIKVTSAISPVQFHNAAPVEIDVVSFYLKIAVHRPSL